MRVRIPSPLRSYTNQAGWVDGDGATVDELLRDLDRAYPGMRFRIVDEQDRIRQHIAVFLNKTQIHDLATPLGRDDGLRIIGALSGG